MSVLACYLYYLQQRCIWKRSAFYGCLRLALKYMSINIHRNKIYHFDIETTFASAQITFICYRIYTIELYMLFLT